ncbi:Checkpoint serine/threonine-protein kinase bub1 [Termitomyces sp. J132]|nr:Checkpoint serine/threonine-protein kinase bub1 [Termitomyces sp. J132]
MNDPIYKTDLRYLKLWTLYAGQVDRANAIDIYANLLASEIGTSFALLYEGYAALLEIEGRHKDAEVIYRQGIRRQARPLERLKKRYQEFQNHNPSTSLDRPRRPLPKRNVGQAQSASSSPATLTRVDASSLMSMSGTPESRYAVMLAPPDPGKRPENYCFNMSLLFTREGGEFSIQEARARSMGLLGKKWPPPPESFQFPADTSSESMLMPADFNDDGSKSTFGGRRRSILGGAEPTVTINTRAALDDVFGMYNSPDRTMMAGSKYGPLRQVRPSSIGLTPRTPAINDDENVEEKGKTPAPDFRPFVDENLHSSRTPSARIQPFVDETKAPLTTTALSAKDLIVENHPSNMTSEIPNSRSAFAAKVFTPAQPKLAPLRNVFTEAHRKSQPKTQPAHERAESNHDAPSPGSNNAVRTFTPFGDENTETPFKVFSRPPHQPENVFTPKTSSVAFTPFVDPKPTFTPLRDVTPAFTPHSDRPSESVARVSQSRPIPLQTVFGNTACTDDGREPSQYDDDDEYDGDDGGQGQAPLEPAADNGFEDGDSYQEIPLGGRFGRFNVMTPITERTFEFTTSTRGSATPSDRLLPIDDSSVRRLGSVFTLQRRDEHGAVIAAEKLAAELKEEEADEPLEPLHLSAYLPPKESPGITIIEERTGALSLGDSLTLGSQFKPPNPCNPFDPPIIMNILSRIPSDPHFYDLRDQESNRLDGLQKFARKSRKTSGSGSTGVLDVSACFSLELEGHKFSVMEKLGEGGFGAVFKARDVGAGGGDEDLDNLDDDGDEENVSIVAVKIVKPRNLWEYHVLRRIHSVLPVSLRRSIILPHALYVFRDESFLILDLCPQGTLLNIVNNAVTAGVSQQGACLDELLVIFFTVELLRLLEAMHRVGFIHGDLKIDNCLVRLEDVPGGAAAWSSAYSPSGEGGWSHKGLKVIDFGRTIDLRLFPSGQQFIADWPTDDRDCFEARQDRSWTFQTDYFGLAGIIYCMLFGKYIHVGAIDSASTRHKLSTPLKRYWQTDLWNRLFDVLLNPTNVKPNGQLPVSEELGVLRGEMEDWLQKNCNRPSGTLKGLLKKVEVSCYKLLG